MKFQPFVFSAALVLFYSALCVTHHVPVWVNAVGMVVLVLVGPILFGGVKLKK
jgi:hypothetical protein